MDKGADNKETGKGNGRQTQPNPPQPGLIQPQDSPNVIGYTMTQQVLKDTINVLKKLPWEDVFQIMPELIAAKPIHHEPKKEG